MSLEKSLRDKIVSGDYQTNTYDLGILQMNLTLQKHQLLKNEQERKEREECTFTPRINQRPAKVEKLFSQHFESLQNQQLQSQ